MLNDRVRREKEVLFHRDNALAHSPAIAAAKVVELRYELLPFPSHSPVLVGLLPLLPFFQTRKREKIVRQKVIRMK